MKLVIALFVIVLPSYAQTDWKFHQENGYSIGYPEQWQLITDGTMGTKFILLSPLSSGSFKDNINLIVEDLAGKNISLEEYTALSANQVKQFITEASIINDKKLDSKHELSFKGIQGQFKLKWCQYYWVENEKAFVLTFTASQDTFEASIADAKRIMDTFKVDY